MLTSNFIDAYFGRMIALAGLAEKVVRCRKCDDLNEKRTLSAPGYGTPMSPVILLGQSLCTACMETQIPFTRGSGYLIDRALAEIEKFRWDVFITNVVHCHPPNNRPSKEQEIQSCLIYLVREINIVRPTLIVCLGRDAASAISSISDKTVEMEMQDMMAGEHCCTVVRVHHPAYAMRGGCDADKWVRVLARMIEPLFDEFPIDEGYAVVQKE